MRKLKIVASNRVKDNAAFMDFLRNLPKTFDETGTEIHTARNRLRIIDVSSLGVEGLSRVMVKRYHGLFWFQKFDYTYIRKPKCRKAYDNTAELRRRGFEAAEEFAYVEVWNHGLYQYAFFVSAVGEGERLDSLCLRLMETGFMEEQHEVISQFATTLAQMHQKGILYNDMNGGNVMCSRNSGETSWHFCLIDTNRATFDEENHSLDLNTCIPDLILMNPRTGMVEDFISEYLKQRGFFSDEEFCRIRTIQRNKYEKKRPIKTFLKRYKQKYYKWLEKN